MQDTSISEATYFCGEPCAVKVASTVLGGGNGTLLFGERLATCKIGSGQSFNLETRSFVRPLGTLY